MITKENLLSTGLVIDNKYLNQYVDLINSNEKRKREKFKTQRHHIIPKHFFERMKLPIDNSKQNFVNLLYKDHAKAHLLLACCAFDDEVFLNNYLAMYYMFKKIKIDIGKIDFEELQKEYEFCKEKAYKYNPMFIEEYKNNHDKVMRSSSVRNKISNTMKKKVKEGTLFSPEHRKKLSLTQRDMIYVSKDNKLTRIHENDLDSYLKQGWQKYEKRSYDQLCGREMMTVKPQTFGFSSRNISCYCILDTGERHDFNSIRDATIWWFENFHPFGGHFSECVLQRKIKLSIKGGLIIYGNRKHKKYKEITNIKWFKSNEGGGAHEKVNTNQD